MGMFDTVNVPCPQCGTIEDYQSKAGDCSLMEYTLEEAPTLILADLGNQCPVVCRQCGTPFCVKVTITAEAVRWTSEPDDDVS